MEKGFSHYEKQCISRFVYRLLKNDLDNYLNTFDKEGKITIRIDVTRKNKPVEELDPRSNKKIKIFK